jgi:PleD family two-component response regulator
MRVETALLWRKPLSAGRTRTERKMVVLMIDDVLVNLDMYGQILQRIGGTELVSFTSSSDALAWAGEAEPDVVLVDYNMPALNGLQFVERFRQLAGKDLTPIIMITGARERDVRYSAFKLGVNDFLTNPPDPADLEARVRNMLTLRKCHLPSTKW